MHVVEMRMLKGMCGIVRKDRITNEHIKGKLCVAPIKEKIKEFKLLGSCTPWKLHFFLNEIKKFSASASV